MDARKARRLVVATMTTLAVALPMGAAAAKEPGPDGPKAAASSSPAVFASQPQALTTARGVNTVDTTALDTQTGTSVVATPEGKVAIAFGDEGAPGNHDVGIATSSNNGLTFTDRGSLPDTAAGEAGQARLAYAKASGRTYAVAAGADLPHQLQLFASADVGATWSAPTQVAPSLGNGNVEFDPSIAVDDAAGTGQGNVYVCWSQTNNPGVTQQVLLGRSSDGGATFTPGTGLTIGSGGLPGGCQVAVGPDHRVYAFYVRNTSFTAGEVDLKILVRRSTDLGATFGPEVVVADLVGRGGDAGAPSGAIDVPGHLVPNSFPQVAVSPTGLVVVAYNDVTSTGRSRVMYVRSTNKGGTWTTPAVASSETVGQQYQPSVAFNADGTTAMFGYYSSADTVTGATTHRQGRIATVASNKLTMLPSFQLGPESPSPASLGDFAVEHAGHDEIVGGTSFHSTWSDARTGNPFHARQLDVQYARVASQPSLTNVSLNFVGPVTTAQGDQFTTAAKVLAAGGDPATDVWVRMTMPAGLVAQSISASGGGQCYREGRVLGCYFATLGGPSRTITVTGIATGKGTQTIRTAVTTSSKDDNTGDNAPTLGVVVQTGNVRTTTITTPGPVDIPDNSEVSVPIDVEADGTVLGATVRVRLTHTWDHDVDLYLVSPAGTMVELSTDNGLSDDDYGTGANDCSGTPTEFRDNASTSIVAGAAPFAGAFKPEGSLASLAGESLQGQWQLLVADDSALDTGTLGCVGLVVSYN